MKNIFVFALMMSVLFLGCSESEELPNEEIVVYQEAGLKIDLISINDGRCPTNVDCIWAGNAEVGLNGTYNNETMFFILNTACINSDCVDYPASTPVFGFNVELLNLDPYPEYGVEYVLEDYTVNLSVD